MLLTLFAWGEDQWPTESNETWGTKFKGFFKPKVDTGIEYERADNYFWESREKWLKKQLQEDDEDGDKFFVEKVTKYW
jgi:hypothetical protein